MLYMKRVTQLSWFVSLSGLVLATILPAPCAPLTAGKPIVLENTQGGFDFIEVDAAKHRLLLAHTGNKTLDVFDLNSHKLLKSVPTGAAQDCAADTTRGCYYVSVSSPPQMAIVDAVTLKMTGAVPLPADADLMNFNPANGLAYVCNDTAPELWVIDPVAKKITTTLTLKGKGMEGLVFDPKYQRLFQAIKTGDLLAVIDLSNHQVLATWSTAPASNPHGIALVPEADTILVAGANGKLVMLNRSTGKLVASADIAARVDEMAYDSQSHQAYCASSQGKISVVEVGTKKLTTLGDVPTAVPVKSIVVDPATHTVWVAYRQGEQSFVQPFTVPQ